MRDFLRTFGLAGAVALSPIAASAALQTATIGGGAPMDGWATSVTYDDAAARGTSNDRDNPLNALGATDGDFFEIGLGGVLDFAFGAQFTGPAMVIEVTFGNVLSHPESVDVFTITGGGTPSFVDSITNADAQAGGGGATLTLTGGPFDILRLVDTTSGSGTGGFDIDSVKVSLVPLPAAGLMLVTALGGAAALRRRKKASAA